MAKSNANKKNHEEFSVGTGRDRSSIVRPVRQSFNEKDCRLQWGDRTLPVANLSSFGLAVICETEEPSLTEGFHLELKYKGISLANVHLKRVHTQPSPGNNFEIGFEVIGEPVRMERIFAIQAALESVSDLEEASLRRQVVPESVRLLVLDMEESLSHFQSQLDAIEKRQKEEFPVQWHGFSQTFATIVSDQLENSFQPFYDKLSATLEGCSQSEVQSTFAYFREKIGHFLYQAPYAGRGYYKPRGYAGDFEMMNHIYDNDVAGESLFARCLHQYFIDVPAAKAVRNRANFLKKKIAETTARTQKKGRPAKILAVAAGPAKEVQMFMSETAEANKSQAEFHFVDQDKGALLHGQRLLREIQAANNTNFDLRFLHLAIKNIIEEGLPENDYDLIYSAGLFDYLSDPVAKFAVQKLFGCLAPEGKLVIGNFSLSNPNQFGMELALDWSLIYRSPEDMKKMFSLIDKDVQVDEEQLGINLFAVTTK